MIHGKRFRNLVRDFTVYAVDGEVFQPTENDTLRVIIGRGGRLTEIIDSAELVVTSEEPTANGSSFEINTPELGVNRLSLVEDDLSFDAGSYTLLIELKESELDVWRTLSRRVFVLEEA